MKGKRIFAPLALLCTLIALFIPLTAAADACPPENPDCNIEPPQSIEVNPDPLHADGSPVELEEPGALLPQLIPMPLPRRVDPLPLDNTPAFETLTVPVRLQDPADVSCGVQALGMAMSRLGEDAPTSDAILAFLKDSGMMYDFGTGVEELAYAAQSLGYKGSVPFHDWTLEDLQTELSEGRPVVVALGSGESNAGHFVTVTGISPDGQWIAFNDPTLGEQLISTEDFLSLWSMQGNSGVMVRAESPIPGLDLMPWVTFLAGLMALITQTPLLRWRRGIGGRLDPGVGGSLASDPPTPPVYVPPPKPTPVYVPPAPQPPAPQPAAIEPPTENDRLTELEQQLDPVILPEPTPEQAKLTRLEQHLDPVILLEPTPEENKLTRLEPQLDPVIPPEPTPEEPELVTVPSFWSDPVGWFQAIMINLGRTNEDAREVMTATLAPTADFLLDVGEFREDAVDFLRQGADGWGQAVEGFTDLLGYGLEAAWEGRWEDVERTILALNQVGPDALDAIFQMYDELPFPMQVGVSIIPGGDAIDIVREGRNFLRGEGVDGLVLSLSIFGLLADLGMLNGLIPDPVDGANAGLAALKAIIRNIPEGPAREAIEQMMKNSDELAKLLEAVAAIAKNSDELAALARHEDAIAILLKGGPEVVELAAKYGDDGVRFIAQHGDEAIEILRGINITDNGWRHLLDRHMLGSVLSEGKSIFLEGVDVTDLIRDAERVVPVIQPNGNFARTLDAGRIIGNVRGTWEATTLYTVIVNRAGELVTAFPGLP